ncbi:GNAT family N-acetyltransferase [Aminipila terrae]|uniref:GNAT family N-acetyltransferase n=1 Tax=Aminipila terrae TaxID=2697030 RepID=A0A6P1MEQ2_9FIRM|nr:GNAT family N-acetyltransferase [Aminipila terrae]
MVIETERLEIIPLNTEQLRLWVEDIPALEKSLACSYKAEPMEGFFLDIVRDQLEVTESDQENYFFHSFWFLIRKSDRVVVGSADFKDIPDEKAQVEIGYGLGKEFEHKGYMTEAVKAMCQWAMKQPGVSYVIAETDLDGYASQRILERCGFTQIDQGETLWWKYEGSGAHHKKIDMDKLRNNKLLKGISLIVALILPALVIKTFTLFSISDVLNPYDYLWSGFYGSILVCFFFKNKILKSLVVCINALIILFLLYFSLMGGIQAPLRLFIEMIVPIVPDKWVSNLVYYFLPLSKYPPI